MNCTLLDRGVFAFLLVWPVLFCISCRKSRPHADFIFQKNEYAAGEMLLVENNSQNDYLCRWAIVDESGDTTQRFEGRNPDFRTFILYPNGIYRLKLMVTKKRGHRPHTIEKMFMIKTPVRNYLNINTYTEGDHENYNVFVDGQFVGHSNYSGSFQAAVPAGYRIVKVRQGNDSIVGMYNFNNTISIEF